MTRLAVIFLCCCAAACGPKRFKWQKLEVEPQPLDPRSPQNREVLLASDHVEFHLAQGRAVADETIHVAVRALKPDAIERFIDVPYDRTFYARPLLRARVLFPSGTTHEISSEKAWDVPLYDKDSLYSDTRVLRLPLPVIPPGAILEWQSTQRIVDLKPLTFRHPFGSVDPVKLSRMSVSLPPDWELEWRAQKLGEPYTLEPKVEKTADAQRWTWEARDTPAHPAELFGLDARHEVPRLTVRLKRWVDDGESQTAFATAKELSAWMWQNTAALHAPDDAMRATVAKVLQNPGDDKREQARKLYEHACETIRYCAISIGYGGWFPHSASQVQAKRYGDCKDKSTYLQGLLEVAGIDSKAAAIHAHDGFPQAFGLPSLGGNFNHEILRIDLPGGPVWVDPTTRTVPFGDLPPADLEGTALPIEPGGAELQQVPSSAPDDHLERQAQSLKLQDDGRGRGTFLLDTTGIPASELRGQLLHTATANRARVVSAWLELQDAKVVRLEKVEGMKLERGLSISGELEVPNMLLGAESARMVRLSGIAPRWLPSLPHGERRTPVLLARFRARKSGEVRLELPPTLSVKRVPPKFTRESKWFDYRLTFRAEGKTVIAERTLTVKERVVPLSEVQALREALDAVHQAENVPVLLQVAR